MTKIDKELMDAVAEFVIDRHNVSMPMTCVAEVFSAPALQAKLAEIERMKTVLDVAREALPMMDDPGNCPYLLQNGEEGTYGPNTCGGFGCTTEPECSTCGPFPSEMIRKALADFDGGDHGQR